jgi:hypothetical protein
MSLSLQVNRPAEQRKMQSELNASDGGWRALVYYGARGFATSAWTLLLLLLTLANVHWHLRRR